MTPIRTLCACVLMLCAAVPDARAGERVLTICTDTMPAGFDPAASVAREALPLGPAQIFDRLVAVSADGITIEPRLARWWDISRDGLEYVFKLRSGVRFHSTETFTPTRALNADDIAFSFARLMAADHPFSARADQPGYADMLGLSNLITAVEKLDEDRVRMKLSRPDTAILALLAMDFASIQSAEYADSLAKAGDDAAARFVEAPVGTGPFQLSEASVDVVTLAAFESHWEGRPLVDRLVIRRMPQATDRFTALGDGGCAISVSPDPADLPALSRDGAARIVTLPRDAAVYLAFNTAGPALSDPRVRRTLADALDRPALAALAGGAEAAHRLTPPHGEAGPDEMGDAADGHASAPPERADVSGLSLKILSASSRTDAGGDRIAEAIASAWRKTGASVEVETLAWSDYFAALSAGDHDAAIVGFEPDTPDDALTLATLLGCAARGTANFTGWCNRAFEDQLDAAKLAQDPARRAEAIEAAQAIVIEDVPAVPLFRPAITLALARSVSGLDAGQLARGDFRGATVAPRPAPDDPGEARAP